MYAFEIHRITSEMQAKMLLFQFEPIGKRGGVGTEALTAVFHTSLYVNMQPWVVQPYDEKIA